MKVIERLKAGGKVFSFEFYPPKTEQDSARLFEAARELKKLNPDFVSVTHSSNGTLPNRTVALSGVLKTELGFEVVAHLTCVAHTRAEIKEICAQLKTMGIKNILALRGDIHNLEGLEPRRDYSYASQLTAELLKTGGLRGRRRLLPGKAPGSRHAKS